MSCGLLKDFLCGLSDSQDFWVLFDGQPDLVANYRQYTDLIGFDCDFVKAVTGPYFEDDEAFLQGNVQLFRTEDIQVITADDPTV